MYINLLTLIRKVIPDAKIITERQFLIDEIIEMAKTKIENNMPMFLYMLQLLEKTDKRIA